MRPNGILKAKGKTINKDVTDACAAASKIKNCKRTSSEPVIEESFKVVASELRLNNQMSCRWGQSC